MNGGTFNNEGHMIFNANATIDAAATFTMGPSGSDLTVGADADVTINSDQLQSRRQRCGNGDHGQPRRRPHAQSGRLRQRLRHQCVRRHDHAQRRRINVTTGDAEFVMDGVLNMNSTAGSLAGWTGRTARHRQRRSARSTPTSTSPASALLRAVCGAGRFQFRRRRQRRGRGARCSFSPLRP